MEPYTTKPGEGGTGTLLYQGRDIKAIYVGDDHPGEAAHIAEMLNDLMLDTFTTEWEIDPDALPAAEAWPTRGRVSAPTLLNRSRD